MKRTRTDEERRSIGERVQLARGAQPLEAAAREAGMSSITLGRVEAGLPVREDRLAAALAYADARQAVPPGGVQHLTDDQLIEELRRRLAATPESEASSDAAATTMTPTQLRARHRGEDSNVKVTTTKAKPKGVRHPKGS